MTFDGATLIVPDRVYYSVWAIGLAMRRPGDTAVVAACLGSRSHNGYVRQRSIERLLQVYRPWAVPYLVEALGDYVLEILQVLQGQIPGSHEQDFAEYLIANEARFIYLSRRCVSYWKAFDGEQIIVRPIFSRWLSYPGAQLITELTDAARLLAPTFGAELRNVLPRRRGH